MWILIDNHKLNIGCDREKVRLLFDAYDLDRNGILSGEEFKLMIKSVVELSNKQHLDELDVDTITQEILAENDDSNKCSVLNFDTFYNILTKHCKLWRMECFNFKHRSRR